MRLQKFSKSEAIRFGWTTTKNNLGFFISLLIVVRLFYFVSDLIIELIKDETPILSSIMSIIFWVSDMVIQKGLIRISLKFCDNEKWICWSFLLLFLVFQVFIWFNSLWTNYRWRNDITYYSWYYLENQISVF